MTAIHKFSIVATAAMTLAFNACALDFYEPTNSTLQMEYVNLPGGSSYSTIVVVVTAYEILGVDGGTAKANTFDPVTNILTLGAVSVNKVTYNNVRVHLTGYQLKNAPTKLLASDSPVPMLTSMPATTGYSAGSLEYYAQIGINTIRIAGGFGAVSNQIQLASAAKAHQNYLQSGVFTASGTSETPGNANFLAETPTARCAFYGFTGACIEVATATTSKTNIQTYDLGAPWTTVLSDLQTVLDYRNTLVGIAAKQGARTIGVTADQDPWVYKGVWTSARTNVQLSAEKLNGIVGVYPSPDMTLVGTGGTGDSGTLVLAQFPDETNPIVTTFVIRKEGASSDHPVTLITAGTSTTDGGAPSQPGWAILRATTPLDANARYTASLSGTWKGQSFARNWSFTTGSTTVTPVRR